MQVSSYLKLSVAVAVMTILLKTGAWWISGSVSLLSDALESLVNLAGAVFALAMVTIAARPPDDDHPYGHHKAEYFSSGFEGVLIFVAALAIIWAAVDRLMAPRPLEAVGWGIVLSVLSSALNGVLAWAMLRKARSHRSMALEADARHLFTDVWTSAGVIAGVGLVVATGWNWLDPVIALAVAVNIVWTGWQLMRRSASGLMDVAMPAEQVAAIEARLAAYASHGIAYHALRTRQAGQRSFASVHLLVPGKWTVQVAHDWAERIEQDLREAVAHCHVTTHIEPIEDPLSMADQHLER